MIALSSSVIRPRITADPARRERSASNHSTAVRGDPPIRKRHKANPAPYAPMLFGMHLRRCDFFTQSELVRLANDGSKLKLDVLLASRRQPREAEDETNETVRTVAHTFRADAADRGLRG